MAETIVNNEQIFQFYVLTTAECDFSSYEKHMMYRPVKLAQEGIEGIKLKDNLRKIALTNFGRETTMPALDILKDEQDRHYIIIKAALRSPSGKHIEYEDNKVWSYTPVIAAPEIKKNSGSIKFYVFDNIWGYLLDFTRGFKKYELITAMKFKSVYTMRFYELMFRQTKPLFVPLKGPDRLHERLYLQGKYEKINDFRRKAIDVAKEELDESSPYSFVVKGEKAGKKITGWTFFFIFYEDGENPALQEQTRMAKAIARLQLESNIYDHLKFSLGFKSDEVNKNKKTLIEEQNRIPDFIRFLGELKEGARLTGNPKGYVIGAIKGRLRKIQRKEGNIISNLLSLPYLNFKYILIRKSFYYH